MHGTWVLLLLLDIMHATELLPAALAIQSTKKGHTDRQTNNGTGRQAHRRTDRQVGRHAGRQADSHRPRHTGGRTDTYGQTVVCLRRQLAMISSATPATARNAKGILTEYLCGKNTFDSATLVYFVLFDNTFEWSTLPF